MMNLKAAKRYAKQMATINGEPWIVFITPADAPCNQPGFSTYNEGRFAACPEAEKQVYMAGGASFPSIQGRHLVFQPEAST